MKTFKVTYKTTKSNTRKTMYAEAANDIQAMNICSVNVLGAIPLHAEMDNEITAEQKQILMLNIAAHLAASGRFTISNVSYIYGEVELHTNDIQDLFSNQVLMDEVIAFNILELV